MEKFNILKSVPANLPMMNVDTDMIIPKQFLKTIKRSGLGKSLFFEMRYDEQGKKVDNFVLNKEPYNKSSILLAGKNFGCGSSREHAPWALLDFGIKCIISTSFADIFYNNCFKNGLLPIVIKEEIIENLFGIAKDQLALEVEVNLETQSLSIEAMNDIFFEIEPGRKEPLLLGLDDIGMTFMHSDQIREFEVRHRQAMPWIFDHD